MIFVIFILGFSFVIYFIIYFNSDAGQGGCNCGSSCKCSGGGGGEI